MTEGYIHSFETFGTVDGPGIRFVTFVKGCPMRCKYCHNPDTWTIDGAQKFTPEQIVNQILKYKSYYQNGGMTISGGEPLLQIDFITEVFSLCKKKGIHTALDTSGIIFNRSNKYLLAKFDELIKYVDLVLLDIKHINNEKHMELTGQPNTNILDFARYLDENNKAMWIRHVLVPGITLNDEYLKQTKAFIDTLKHVEKVEVLPYHTMGIVKYKQLGLPYPLEGVNPPTKEEVEHAREILSLKR